MTTLTDKIKQCRAGVIDNPYQGKDKKVLFVCTAGILRSATGARLYAPKYNTRAAGTMEGALVPLSTDLLDWADEIVFVNPLNYKMACDKFNVDQYEGYNIKILNIPDDYEHMHPEMIKAFEQQYEPLPR